VEAVEREVIYLARAEATLDAIFHYVTRRGYPETAERFVKRLVEFGNALGRFPEKFAPCRFSTLSQSGQRCAVFEQDYVFVYHVRPRTVVITNIMHVKRLR
jgi:plasmid stabilization system protein ParE